MGKLHIGARSLLCACAVSWIAGSEIRAEDVVFELIDPPGVISPGDQIAIVVRLEDNETPNELTGYSLNVDILPDAGASGTVISNPLLSNFFDIENLITQGGGALHDLSIIFDPGDGGLFVNALTADLLPVELAGPGHDVFAELIFDVSLDAEGLFTIDLGFGSVLADVNFEPIDFDVQPLTFEVVPEPASVALLAVLGLLAVGRGRNTSARRSSVA